MKDRSREERTRMMDQLNWTRHLRRATGVAAPVIPVKVARQEKRAHLSPN
jgi:hypothetical protein